MKKIILVFAIVATMFGCNLVSGNAEVVKESEEGFYQYYKIENYQGGVFKNATTYNLADYSIPGDFYKDKCLYRLVDSDVSATKPTEPSTAYQYKKVDGSIVTYWVKDSYKNKASLIFKIGDVNSNGFHLYKHTATNNYLTKEYYFNNVINTKYIYIKR
jgi:hypothetical protein